jgi:hypothetical protein
VVLSLWRGGTCTGTFRIPVADVPGLVAALQDGLAGAALPASGPSTAPRPAPRSGEGMAPTG